MTEKYQYLDTHIEYRIPNPYELPVFLIGVTVGILVWSAWGESRKRKLISLSILLVGMCLCWRLKVEEVWWNFSHPINYADGPAKAGVLFFGWLVVLIIHILPVTVLLICANRMFKFVAKLARPDQASKKPDGGAAA